MTLNHQYSYIPYIVIQYISLGNNLCSAELTILLEPGGRGGGGGRGKGEWGGREDL